MRSGRGERPDDHAGTDEAPRGPDDAGDSNTSTD